jgi:protease IV
MAKNSTRLLLWVTAFGLALVVAVGLAVFLLTRDRLPGTPEESRWLYVKVGSLNDAPATPGLFDDPADLPPLTTELTRMLREAAADPAVPGLLVELSDFNAGWAQAQELRDALKDFRGSGKPCIAWAEGWTNLAYMVGSTCSEVQALPTGVMLVNGLAMTQTYYAGTFEKIGVRPNFEHVGDFKSAVEPYERTGPSEPASAANEALLSSLYGQLVAAIAENRSLDPAQVEALIDSPPLSPAEALERGMLDRLSFRDQLRDQVELHDGAAPTEPEPPIERAPGAAEGDGATAKEDEDRTELLHYREYLKKSRKHWDKAQKVRIAVLHAEGAIVNGVGGESLFGGSSIGDRTLNRQIRELREDDSVKAIVLRVNSPGGSGSASDSILRELELTRGVKPLVVSMGDYAASGGYFISMGADHIVAQPSTLTGSIGVFGGKLNLSGALVQLGLSQHTWQRGEQATLLSGMHDFDEAGRERFRTYMQAFYDHFLARAAEGRGMTVDQVHAVAQGRVWTGEQALEHGLVDELGGLEVALARALELSEAGVPMDQVRVVRYPERKTFFQQMMEELEGKDPTVQAAAVQAAAIAALDPEAGSALAHLWMLQEVLADGEIAALLPGSVEIR